MLEAVSAERYAIARRGRETRSDDPETVRPELSFFRQEHRSHGVARLQIRQTRRWT
jgi:hypothetical protein